MNIRQLVDLSEARKLSRINFIESGSGPIVIEVEFKQGEKLRRALLKDDHEQVITCRNLKEGYDLCLKANVHEAYLVQIIPHDEACHSAYAEYHRDAIPLKF